MYLIDSLSAAELSRRSGSGTSWIIGGDSFENLAKEDDIHLPLHRAAPGAARDLARRLHDALDGAILPGSESDSMGRVVLITSERCHWANDERLPPKVALLRALGLKEEVDGINLLDEATLSPEDVEGVWLGLDSDDEGSDDEESDDEEPDEDREKAKRVTDIVASELIRHFELNFTEKIVCAPVLYGGQTSDGSIVAILSMRVWT